MDDCSNCQGIVRTQLQLEICMRVIQHTWKVTRYLVKVNRRGETGCWTLSLKKKRAWFRTSHGIKYLGRWLGLPSGSATLDLKAGFALRQLGTHYLLWAWQWATQVHGRIVARQVGRPRLGCADELWLHRLGRPTRNRQAVHVTCLSNSEALVYLKHSDSLSRIRLSIH